MGAKTRSPTSEGSAKATSSQSSSSLLRRTTASALIVAVAAVLVAQFSGKIDLHELVSTPSSPSDTVVQEAATKKKIDVPESGIEPAPSSEFVALEVEFRNTHATTAALYWVNNEQQETFMANIEPEHTQTFTTYDGHMWVWRDTNNNNEWISSAVIKSSTTLVTSVFQTQFHEQYHNDNGFSWINTYPREPMVKYVPDPVEIGHVAELELGPAQYTKEGGIADKDSTMKIRMETVGIYPKIFLIEDFLSEDEADHIREQAIELGTLKRSGVKTTGEVIDSRTSRNNWIPATHDQVIENVFRRAYSLLKVDFSLDTWEKNSESLQVIHYDVNQQYQEHYDYFAPPDYPAYKAVQQGNNRYATVFMYLNDTPDGGETCFPRFDKKYVRDACDAPQGKKVKPKKGRVALFFSMLPDGNLDFDSLHAGCPVKEGEKWGSNLWFWDHVLG